MKHGLGRSIAEPHAAALPIVDVQNHNSLRHGGKYAGVDEVVKAPRCGYLFRALERCASATEARAVSS